jgi:DNA polymerase
MKNLKNALLLKQLYLQKEIGFCYTSALPYSDNEPNLSLPHSLQELKQQANNCHLCQLSKSRTNVVFGEGNEDAKLMFVGEGPGATEDSMGKPFVGKSGELLTKMIENVLLLKREDVYIANIVKCRPPNNRTPHEEEAYTCLPYLQKQIELINPQIIVTLGATAYRYLTNDTTAITKIRSTIHTQNGYKLIPTYHPSYLLRNPSAKKEAFEDLKLIKSLLDTI